MRILAIESSGQVASAAIADGGSITGEYSVNYGAGVFGPKDTEVSEAAKLAKPANSAGFTKPTKQKKKKTHSETLLPMIDELLGMTDTPSETIEAIAVSKGPGSFTGLRIGAATAKGLAFALGIPVIPVPTVDMLAANLWGFQGTVCPMMDARRAQVYAGLYTFLRDGAGFRLLAEMEQTALAVDDIIEKVNSAGRPAVFLGDGVAVYRDRIEALCSVEYSLAPAHLLLQRAGSLAYLAEQYAREGRLVNPDAFSPEYLRESGAKKQDGTM